jgi:hypothetical protein
VIISACGKRPFIATNHIRVFNRIFKLFLLLIKMYVAVISPIRLKIQQVALVIPPALCEITDGLRLLCLHNEKAI